MTESSETFSYCFPQMTASASYLGTMLAVLKS
uniref:Uncharacterized protein n=1 Tax=Anguilla anguilla TaxID=7936 RepID=A0A0E9T6X5_ANGAN